MSLIIGFVYHLSC
uniref:Uncharacterized protein n=1 Tax=Rhizophora mucronata TaxID=61149 RepID=A0A2P2MS48_RHIMU